MEFFKNKAQSVLRFSKKQEFFSNENRVNILENINFTTCKLLLLPVGVTHKYILISMTLAWGLIALTASQIFMAYSWIFF